MSQETSVRVRHASNDDVPAIAGLVQVLAHSIGESSQLYEGYVRTYLATPGCGVLLADAGGATLGLLSYSVRPNLYHAAPCGLIEELVVHPSARGRGIGTLLLREALRVLETIGCAEASVSTLPGNQAAQRLYRELGFIDEAVLLEKHFARA